MNPIERVIRRIDATQQRFTLTAFIFAVFKKYGDDNGGVLVANLAYSSFIALFPLLLVLVTVLGLAASVNAAFRQNVIDAVAHQVPQIGSQLTGNVKELRRSSVIGLIVGLAAVVWGATGLAQAGLFTMEQVWNLPGPARPGYFQRLGRAMEFLGVLGVGVILTTLLAALNTYGKKPPSSWWWRRLPPLSVNVGMYYRRVPGAHPEGCPDPAAHPGRGDWWDRLDGAADRRHLPGAPLPAQQLGLRLLRDRARSGGLHQRGRADHRVRGRGQCGAHPSAVAALHRAAAAHRGRPGQLALQALQNQRREEQHIEVSFDDRPPGDPVPHSTPQTPEDVAPPDPLPPPPLPGRIAASGAKSGPEASVLGNFGRGDAADAAARRAARIALARVPHRAGNAGPGSGSQPVPGPARPATGSTMQPALSVQRTN